MSTIIAQPTKENNILIMHCDYKENLSKSEMKEMMTNTKLVNGSFQELDVYTADARVFVSASDSFFDLDLSEYGDAFEVFMDSSAKYDENSGEIVNEIDTWFMHNNELYVKTTENEIMKFVEWYNSLN